MRKGGGTQSSRVRAVGPLMEDIAITETGQAGKQKKTTEKFTTEDVDGCRCG